MTISVDRCTACLNCVVICPIRALEADDDQSQL
ncbi:4Fe-4S binding protein [candidate division KSB1 bacterium]|nr:4Fe-4S binding protein [candidate division KSB1 bacterium]